MKLIKTASDIKSCCASCNGSGWSGGTDGFVKKQQVMMIKLSENTKQRAA